MFKDDLFTIKSEEINDLQASFRIRLNRGNAIYSGHFPGDAITPGVCVVQIAVDLFSHLQGRAFALAQAKNIKFINIIKPDEHPEVEYQLSWEALDNGNFKIKATVTDNDTTFSKIVIEVSESSL